MSIFSDRIRQFIFRALSAFIVAVLTIQISFQ